jgi:hypothetical protein
MQKRSIWLRRIYQLTGLVAAFAVSLLKPQIAYACICSSDLWNRSPYGQFVHAERVFIGQRSPNQLENSDYVVKMSPLFIPLKGGNDEIAVFSLPRLCGPGISSNEPYLVYTRRVPNLGLKVSGPENMHWIGCTRTAPIREAWIDFVLLFVPIGALLAFSIMMFKRWKFAKGLIKTP